MIKKLLSLFAIATLTSFAAYAEEAATNNAPVILEEQVNEENAKLAVNDVLIEEEVQAEEAAQEVKLADCECGCNKCDKSKTPAKTVLAGCGCKGKKKSGGQEEVILDPVQAPAATEMLADNTPVDETAEEILPTEAPEAKLASCCQGSCAPATAPEAPIVEEVVQEEVKLA